MLHINFYKLRNHSPCALVTFLAFHWPRAHDVTRPMGLFSVLGCGKTTGADLLGVESEPWVFKGGVSGEVQVIRCFISDAISHASVLRFLIIFYSSRVPKTCLMCVFFFSRGVQMLLPIGNSSELFTHPPPLFPTSRLYNIRPYHSKDKVVSPTHRHSKRENGKSFISQSLRH